ncbi:MAG: hypothetical protein LBF92_00935 [Synergistaceae bacterium]|jgi:uncharacterized protein YukE|nr:hypothetical protein [Synergistaceae bacterium]
MGFAHIRKSIVRENVNNMRSRIREQSDFLSNMDKEINFLSEVWDSPAQKEYARSFQATKEDVMKFLDAMGRYADIIESSVDSLETIDDRLAKSLDTR